MKKKSIIIVIIVTLCVILGIAASVFGVKKYYNKKESDGRVNIAFYNINQSQEQIFTQIIKEICSQKEIPVEFYKIGNDGDFSKEIKDKKIRYV